MSEWLAASQALRAVNESLLGDTRVRIEMSRRILGGWVGIRGGSSTSSDDSEHPHWPIDELERLVRDKIKRGALVALHDDEWWTVPATDHVCLVCSQAIRGGSECVARGSRGFLFLHPLCCRVWRRESQRREARRVGI